MRAEAAHRLNRRGVKSAVAVVAMTNAIAAELESLYGVSPQVIRPGVRTARPSDRQDRYPVERFRMLSVSRLEPNKRVDWILRALASLESSGVPLSQQIDWTLDIVGEGTQGESLRLLAEQSGLSGRTVFHGRVPDEELETLYASAGLFLMPAVQGYGLPALESLARGVPVILSRESGVAEILRGTPWVEAADDVQGLAGAIGVMAGRLRGGELRTHSLPPIPDESGWAQRISELCGWL
jgi:glycosyltransferase involved in cell wall biosynthesis